MKRFLQTVSNAIPFTSTTNSIPEPPQPESPGQSAPIAIHKIDFTAVGFPEYKNEFALVIDNLFTRADCQKLLDAAEAKNEWEVAQVNGRGGYGFTDLSYRNSSRILYDDFELADWILEKLRPYIGEIEKMPPGKHHMYSKDREERKGSGQQAKHVELSRMNERLRYLKYGPGQFFRRHCDGCYYTDDRTEVSYHTLQLYLNGDKDDLKGGATRFFRQIRSRSGDREFIDVEPRLGRVLIFEQSHLLHSGEEVESGEKITIRTEFMYKDPDHNAT